MCAERDKRSSRWSRRSSRPLNGVQKWKCVRPRCTPTGCLSLSGLTSDISAPSPSFPSYYFLFIPYNDLPDSQYAAADLVLVFALSLLVSLSPALLSSKSPSPSRSFSIQLFFGSHLSDLLFLIYGLRQEIIPVGWWAAILSPATLNPNAVMFEGKTLTEDS